MIKKYLDSPYLVLVLFIAILACVYFLNPNKKLVFSMKTYSIERNIIIKGVPL